MGLEQGIVGLHFFYLFKRKGGNLNPELMPSDGMGAIGAGINTWACFGRWGNVGLQ